MSLHEVAKAIEEWRLDDELAESPGFCRRSAMRMKKVATEADISTPQTKIEILVWPELTDGPNVHYAMQATSAEGSMIFNSCPTPLFPQYQGDAATAPGFLTQMKPTQEIK